MGGSVAMKSAEDVGAMQSSLEEWIATGTAHDSLSHLLNGGFDPTFALTNAQVPESELRYYEALAKRVATAESHSRRWRGEAQRSADAVSLALQRQKDAEHRAQFLEKAVTSLRQRVDAVKSSSASRIANLEERLQLAQDSQNFALEQLVIERATTNEVAKALARGERDSAEAAKALTQVTVHATSALSKILQENQSSGNTPEERKLLKDIRAENNKLRSKVDALEQENLDVKQTYKRPHSETLAMADEDLRAHRIWIQKAEIRLRRARKEAFPAQQENMELGSDEKACEQGKNMQEKAQDELKSDTKTNHFGTETQGVPSLLSEVSETSEDPSIESKAVATEPQPLTGSEETGVDCPSEIDNSQVQEESDVKDNQPRQESTDAPITENNEETEYAQFERSSTWMELRKTAARLLSSDDTNDFPNNKLSDVDAARKYSFVSMDSVTENCDSQSLQDRSVISDDESNDKTHEHAPKSTWLPLSMAAIEEATLPNSMNYVTSRSNPQEGFNYCEVELIRPRSYSEYGVNENGYQQSDASSSSGDIHSNERVADFRVASEISNVKSAPTAAEKESFKGSRKAEDFGRSSPSSQSRVSTQLSDNPESEVSVNTELLRTYSAMKQAAVREMESEWMKQASDLAQGVRDRELSFYRRGLLSAREHQAVCDNTVTTLGALTVMLMARGKEMADSLGSRLLELEELILRSPHADDYIGNLTNGRNGEEIYPVSARSDKISEMDKADSAADEVLSKISQQKDDSALSVHSCPPIRY